jgi:hypothetical protein
MDDQGNWAGPHELPPHMAKLHRRQMAAIRAVREEKERDRPLGLVERAGRAVRRWGPGSDPDAE